MEIKGRVAIVTGGSRGIGKATSLKLTGKEAKIILVYNSSFEKHRR